MERESKINVDQIDKIPSNTHKLKETDRRTTNQRVFESIEKELKISDFSSRFLKPFNEVIKILLPALPRIQWKINNSTGSSVLELADTSIDVHLSEESGNYLFHFKNTDELPFKAPSLQS